MNPGKAVDFVKQSGNEVELARLDYLLTGKRPSQEVVDKLFTGHLCLEFILLVAHLLDLCRPDVRA